MLTDSPGQYSLLIGTTSLYVESFSILSLPSFSLSMSVHKQPSLTTSDIFSILQNINHPSSLYETRVISPPAGLSPYHLVYQQFIHHPLITLQGDLPPINIFINKQVIHSLLTFFLLPSHASVKFPSFHSLVYECPFFSLELSIPALTITCLNDLVTDNNPDDVFAVCTLQQVSLQLILSSQFVDCDINLSHLSLSSSFRHISPPLTQETLTGYDSSIELTTWKEICSRIDSLPERMVELLTIHPVHFHLSSSPECFPSLHFHRILAGEVDRSGLLLRDVACSSHIRLMLDVGDADIQFDDLVVSDFVWAVITIINLYWCQVPCDSFPEQPEFMIDDSNFLFTIESSLLTISMIYNQQLCQQLCAPAVYFEFGFTRYEYNHSFTKSLVECGFVSKGVYWNDLTNQVVFLIWFHCRYWNHGILMKVLIQ